MPSGGSKKQTVGYKYYLGCHMGLCHGPIDTITEIQVDKRVAWTGLVTDGTITVDAPTLFGGEKREGGVSGTIDVEMGYPAQTPNAYLQSQLGADVPAFRGVASLVFNQTYMGNNPYLKPWKFKASRTDVTSDGDEQWYLERAAIARPSEDSVSEECSKFCETGNLAFTSGSVTFSEAFPETVVYNSVSRNALVDGGKYYIPVANSSIATDFDGNLFLSSEYADPYAICGDTTKTHTLEVTGNGTYFIAPNQKAATQHSGTCIIAPAIGGSWLNGAIVQHSVGCEFTSGASTIERIYDLWVGIDYDETNSRARLYFQITDSNIGGDARVYGPYFDIQLADTSDQPWVQISWRCSADTPTWKFLNVNPSLKRWFTHLGYDCYACLTHSVNGVERTEEFLYSGSGIKQAENWVNEPSINTFGLDVGQGDQLHMVAGALHIAHIGSIDSWVFNQDEDEPGIEIYCGGSFVQCTGGSGCDDMNPAHIIRECLTDGVWGMGYTDADIDDGSFELAADTLFSEGMGISILWEKEQPIEEFIGEILRHIDAVLYVSRTSGKFVLNLIRESSSLLTLDESNVSSVTDARRPTISELTNQVAATYWDATTDESASVIAHNEALRLVQGVEISTSVQYPGFTNKSIAARVAERDLKALSTPLLSCEIVASRDAAILNVGDPFTLDWPDLNINQTVMRVDEIDYGDGVDNSIKITAVQDVFSTPALATVSDTDEEWVDPTAASPQASVSRVITETPYYPLILEAGETQANDILADDPDAGFLLASGGRQQNELNANVQVDTGSGYVNSATVDFHPYAYLVGPIGYTDTVLTIESGKDLDLVETGTIAQIGAELVRVDSIDQDSNSDYVSVTVGRGILDTVPQKHETDDSNSITIAFWGDYAISDNEQYVAGESIDVKLQTTQGGAVLDLSDAPADSVTFNSRAIRPYPPGDFRVDGLSYPDAYVWTASHTLTWAHRDRLQQTDGNLYDHTEGDIGPEAGVSYVVEGIAIVGDSVAGDSAVDAPEREKFLDVNVGTDTEYVFDIDSGVFDSNYSEPPEGTTAILLGVKSQRDGYDSWQYPQIRLQYPGFTDSVGDSVGVIDSVGDSIGLIDSIGDSVGVIDSVGDSVGVIDSVGDSVGGAWLPDNISSIKLWLDADDASTLTLSGSDVTDWDDKSGNGKDVSMSTPANRPSRDLAEINSKNTVYFDGSEWLEGSAVVDAGSPQEVSSFAVIKPVNLRTSPPYFHAIVSQGGLFAINDFVFYCDSRSGQSPVFSADGRTNEFDGTGTTSNNNVYIVEALASNAGVDMFINGGAEGSSGSFGTFTPGGTSDLRIGLDDGTRYMRGHIAEVLVYQEKLSQTDREKVEGYLAHKWGLEGDLPSGHPYKSAAPQVDPYFNDVSLLLHMDGTDGNTTFTDDSSSPKTITRNGTGVEKDTGNVKYGTASAQFNGTAGYLSTHNNTQQVVDLTDDFTMEAWVNPDNTSSDMTVLDTRVSSGTQNGFTLQLDADTDKLVFVFWDASGAAWALFSSNTYSADAWQHVAVCRSGSTAYVALDGVVASSAITLTPANGTEVFRVGRSGASSGSFRQFDGHIDDVRVTKGVARYTSSFTPPTAPFPDS